MMEAGKGLWSLIQDQILGMKWLKDAVGAGLRNRYFLQTWRQRTFFYL